MNPSLDILNFMVPASDFMKAFHLTTSDGTNQQVLTWHRREDARTGWIYYVKSNAGYPWDIYYYNSAHVYWSITGTEASVSDPSAYQVFTSVSWPEGKGGIAWCPRFIDAPPHLDFLTTEDTSYETYQGGAETGTGNLGAPGAALVQGPYSLPIGRLGQQTVMVESYQWSEYMTTDWYAQGLGKVRHRLYEVESGIYQLKEDATFDQRVAGGSVEPVFQGELP